MHRSFWNFNPTKDKLPYILESLSPPFLHLLTLAAPGSSESRGLPHSPCYEDHSLELMPRPRGGVPVRSFSRPSGALFYLEGWLFLLPFLFFCSAIRDLFQFPSPESPSAYPQPSSTRLRVFLSTHFIPIILSDSKSPRITVTVTTNLCPKLLW